MANIFHRPMFRRGGSVGTGITSGLEPRKKFQEGGSMDPEEAAAFDLMMKEKGIGPYSPVVQAVEEAKSLSSIDDLVSKDQTLPEVEKEQDAPVSETGYADSTIKQELGDIFTGLAATTPEDPTQLQSYAQVLGKAGTIASGLKKERAAAEQEFKQKVLLEQIKQLDKSESDQLIRYAKQYAAQTGMPEGEAIELFLNRYLKGPMKQDTYMRGLIDDIYQEYRSIERGYTESQAQRIANTLAQVRTGNAPLADVAPRKGFTDKLSPGTYIDPNDGKIYTWDGENKTQVWPTEE